MRLINYYFILFFRYTLVGVTNKVLTITVNMLIWDKHATPFGLGFLILCLIGSATYEQASPRVIFALFFYFFWIRRVLKNFP